MRGLLSLALILVAAVGFPSAAMASAYLVDFVVSGDHQGEYVIEEKESGWMAAPQLFRKAGIPAKEDLALSVLSEHGVLEMDLASQTVTFDPARRDRQRIEKTVAPVPAETPFFGLKSTDYFATLTSTSGQKGYLITTGRLGEFDFDVRAGFGGMDDYVATNWHDEANPYVKDVKIGRVSRYAADGVALTNESQTATDSFASDVIELYWPSGTVVDVFRGGEFLETIEVDSEPFRYEVELAANRNVFRFEAVLPDGQIAERTVLRDVSGRLVRPGSASYYGAFVDLDDNDRYEPFGRVGLGLTPTISAFFGRKRVGEEYTSVLYANDGLALEAELNTAPGYDFSASYSGDDYGLRVGKEKIGKAQIVSANAQAYNWLGRPRLSYRISKSGESRFETSKVEAFASRSNAFGTLSVSPAFQYEESTSDRATEVSAQVLAAIRKGPKFRLKGSSRYLHGADRRIQTLEPSVSIRLWPGRISYTERYRRMGDGQGFSRFRRELRMNVWEMEDFTISGSVIETSDDTQFALSISGSIGESGTSRLNQRHRASMRVSACDDQNLNGYCEESERALPDVPFEVGERKHVGEAHLDNLRPYNQYDIEPDSVLGYRPQADVYRTSELARGEVNEVRLPLTRIRQIEGELPSGEDGVIVELVDQSGIVIDTQKTEFGGWYLFESPMGKDVYVREQGEGDRSPQSSFVLPSFSPDNPEWGFSDVGSP